MIRNDRELEIQFPNSHIILIKNRTALLFLSTNFEIIIYNKFSYFGIWRADFNYFDENNTTLTKKKVNNQYYKFNSLKI